MDKSKLTRLKDQVEYSLQYHPKTRNSDIALTHCIWEQFYPQYVHKITTPNGWRQVILFDDMYLVPREDTVKRFRATFNAAGRFLPTDEVVAIKRGINQDVWHHYMHEHKATQIAMDELYAAAKEDGAFDVGEL